jgi:hypothetical protein
LSNEITINRLFPGIEEFKVVPLRRKREWMSETVNSYAYKCVPMNIANDYGWAVLNPAQFTATWNGSDSPEGVSVVYEEGGEHDFLGTYFGHGILTVGLDFLLQTPKGFQHIFEEFQTKQLMAFSH